MKGYQLKVFLCAQIFRESRTDLDSYDHMLTHCDVSYLHGGTNRGADAKEYGGHRLCLRTTRLAVGQQLQPQIPR